MLKGVPKILSPALLKVLCEMGHGDEIVIADGNFPSETYGKKVIRADGLGGKEILDAVLQMLPLDGVADKNYFLMATGDNFIPPIWKEYEDIVLRSGEKAKKEELERYAFYERAKNAYAVIATGEEAIFANIILKKGVIQ